MSAPLVAQPAAWVDPDARVGIRFVVSRIVALSLVELQKLRHDRTELLTRAVQPALWLIVFGLTSRWLSRCNRR